MPIDAIKLLLGLLTIGFWTNTRVVAQSELFFSAHTKDYRNAFILGTTICFRAAGDQEEPLVYFWDFGDGNQAEGAEVTHHYQSSELFIVSVMARNEANQQGKTLYLPIFINPLQGNFDFSKRITLPEASDSVIKVGETISFAAEADVPVDFFWQIGDSDIFFREAAFSWTATRAFAESALQVHMNAVNDDGIAHEYTDERDFYIYEDNHPPDATVEGPDDFVPGQSYRMNLGETRTFRLVGEDVDGNLPLSLCWKITDANDQTTGIDGENLNFTPEVAGDYYVEGQVEDSEGLADPFSPAFQIFVKGENQVPEGFIISDSMTVETGAPFELEAKGSDPDNDAIRFTWDLGDGRTQEGESLTIEYQQAGVFRIILTAVDEVGAADPTPFQRWIFVNDPAGYENNSEPFAFVVQPVQGQAVAVGETLEFQSFGYDEENQTLAFFWDFGDGTLGMGPQPTKVYTAPCEEYGDRCGYQVQLFARDEAGLSSNYPNNIRLDVYSGAKPPDGVILSPDFSALSVPIDPQNPVEQVFQESLIQLKPGQTIQFKGGVSGIDDLNDYSAFWQLNGDDQTLSFFGFEPPLLSFEAFPASGFYYVSFMVTDAEGVTDAVPTEFTLWLREGNNEPQDVQIVEPNWDQPLEITDGVDLAAFAYDEDGDALSFSWKVEDLGPGGETRCLQGQRFDYLSFPRTGLYRISLTATDSEGAETAAKNARYLSVLPEFDETMDFNEPPFVEISKPLEENVLTPVNSRLTFAMTAIDFEGDAITDYYWDFGNGQNARGSDTVTVRFDRAGLYEVRAFARDANGNWSPYPGFWVVYVYDSNIPPQSRIVFPPLQDHPDPYRQKEFAVLLGQSITFEAQSSDPDGNLPLQASWFSDYEWCEECEGLLTLPPVTMDRQGQFHVSFYATDSKGLADPFGDYRHITVADPELKPETYLMEPSGDITVEPGEELFFFGFGEDPNGLEISYQWDFGPAAQLPQELHGEYVYPVVFPLESPEGQPYTITLTAVTQFTRDPTPATIRVRVKRFEDADFEPNDQFSQAKLLQQGNYSNLSLGSGNGDAADYFQFDIDEPEKDFQLELGLEAQEVPLILRLYRLEGNQFQPLDVGTLDRGAAALVLENMPMGRYIIEIVLTEAGKRLTSLDGGQKMGLNYRISVNTLEPSLFMPFLVEDGNLSSAIGIINTTSSEADLVVVGLSARGQTIATKSLKLNPNGRLFVQSLDFFGTTNRVENAREIAWVKVQSTHRLVGYTNAQSRDGSQLMSVGAVRSLSSSIVVPHIAKNTEAWYTRAIVVNVDESAQGIDFATKTDVQQVSGGLPGNHQLDFRFRDMFAENLPAWGEFRGQSKKAAIAGFEVFGRADGFQEIAGLEMVAVRQKNPNFERIRSNLYFTHVAGDTQNFWTGISLINLSEQQVTFNLVAVDDNGNSLTRRDGETLPRGGKLLGTVAELFPDTTNISWIRVETDDDLAGFELFGDKNATRLAGFQATRSATDTLFFPHLQTEEGKSWTGIALLNISPTQTAGLEIRAYDDAGNMLVAHNRELAPQTKLVLLAQNLFEEGLPSGASYLRVQCDQNILSGFSLFGDLTAEGLLGKQMAGLPALRK